MYAFEPADKNEEKFTDRRFGGWLARRRSGSRPALMAMSLPVLTFHALDTAASVISFTPRLFQEGMAMLHAHGYQSIRLSEAAGCLRQRAPFPDRTFVLTFDDGFHSVYREAFPVLERYGLSATVFLTVGTGDAEDSGGRLPTFEGRQMLSWAEIREMHQSGIEFGAHTLTHRDLTRLSAEEVATEMSRSKDRIENSLGTPVTSFAYPFGRYDGQSRRMAEQYFTCACADTLGLVSRRSDPFALERVDAYYLGTPRLFALMVSGFFPWYVLTRNIPRQLRRSLNQRLRS
jgi:peptidoglycan/xylan/chitin deacetylase (PgdA/CDA1 family)